MMSLLVQIQITLLLLLAGGGCAASDDVVSDAQNQDLGVAISEMQRANYFTYIVLLNMISPSDQRFRGNLTFLMPNDRMLSRMSMHQHDVADFLLRHSIPSPMLFDYLQHIPTASIIPSCDPNYMLTISNNGRNHFFLNNVRLITPNICTAGSVFRCHGIDGVLSAEINNSSSSCFTNSAAPPTAPPPLASPIPPLNNNSARRATFPTSFIIILIMSALWLSS